MIGSVLLAPAYDRARGHHGVVVGIYALGAAALFTCISSPSQAPLLMLVFVAGAAAQGGLVTLNGLVDRTYPPAMRSAALGTTLGFGRVGAIVAPSVLGHIVGSDASASFVFFAVSSALAGLLVLATGQAIHRRNARQTSDTASPAPDPARLTDRHPLAGR